MNPPPTKFTSFPYPAALPFSPQRRALLAAPGPRGAAPAAPPPTRDLGPLAPPLGRLPNRRQRHRVHVGIERGERVDEEANAGAPLGVLQHPVYPPPLDLQPGRLVHVEVLVRGTGHQRVEPAHVRPRPVRIVVRERRPE